MEPEELRSEMVLPATLSFKRTQTADKYPKGQSRSRHFKHLKQILQAENSASLPSDFPNYLSIESPPSMYPSKKYCDITGFEAPYVDPRTNLRYTNPDVFKCVRMLPNDHVQSCTKFLMRSAQEAVDDLGSVKQQIQARNRSFDKIKFLMPLLQ